MFEGLKRSCRARLARRRSAQPKRSSTWGNSSLGKAAQTHGGRHPHKAYGDAWDVTLGSDQADSGSVTVALHQHQLHWQHATALNGQQQQLCHVQALHAEAATQGIMLLDHNHLQLPQQLELAPVKPLANFTTEPQQPLQPSQCLPALCSGLLPTCSMQRSGVRRPPIRAATAPCLLPNQHATIDHHFDTHGSLLSPLPTSLLPSAAVQAVGHAAESPAGISAAAGMLLSQQTHVSATCDTWAYPCIEDGKPALGPPNLLPPYSCPSVPTLLPSPSMATLLPSAASSSCAAPAAMAGVNTDTTSALACDIDASLVEQVLADIDTSDTAADVHASQFNSMELDAIFGADVANSGTSLASCDSTGGKGPLGVWPLASAIMQPGGLLVGSAQKAGATSGSSAAPYKGMQHPTGDAAVPDAAGRLTALRERIKHLQDLMLNTRRLFEDVAALDQVAATEMLAQLQEAVSASGAASVS